MDDQHDDLLVAIKAAIRAEGDRVIEAIEGSKTNGPPVRPEPIASTEYYRPENGARLQPHVCVRIAVSYPFADDGLSIITVPPRKGSTYERIPPLDGHIPIRWHRSCIAASSIDRFVILKEGLKNYLIPIAEGGTLLSNSEARSANMLWARADDSFQEENRRAGISLGNLLDHNNRGNALARMLNDSTHSHEIGVVTNITDLSHLRAAVTAPCIRTYTVGWFPCTNAVEAHYLAGLINLCPADDDDRLRKTMKSQRLRDYWQQLGLPKFTGTSDQKALADIAKQLYHLIAPIPGLDAIEINLRRQMPDYVTLERQGRKLAHQIIPRYRGEPVPEPSG